MLNNNEQHNSDNNFTPENLFVDNEVPEASEQVVNSTPSKLAGFLNSDFKNKGYRDGYQYHSADVMDNYIRIIRSEFREIVESMTDDLNRMNAKLKTHLVDVKHLSSKATEKYRAPLSPSSLYIEPLGKICTSSSFIDLNSKIYHASTSRIR